MPTKTRSQTAQRSSSGGMGRLLAILAGLTALLSSVFWVLDKNLNSFYIFDPDQMHDLARRGIAAHGNDTRAVVRLIIDELHGKLPGHINLDEEWIFNNAGGAMGGMYIVHASITEYLLIFGSAIGTEGHSGRHTADDFFHILSGVQTAYVPGEYEAEVYPQGSQHHLRRGTVKQYKMPDGCFALEYARGWIPPMFAFGFADGLTSTLDISTLWRTMWVTCREMVKNLMLGKM